VKAKILVIEDEQSLNNAYEIILKAKGYRVRTAFDGDEALEVVKSFEPDLILLDLRMPNMNGIEFLKSYDLSQHPAVKVVIFSNLDMQSEIDEAFKLGAHRYILKARAAPNDLVRLVKEVLTSAA
jgi:two-component system response regulator AtoC